MDDMKKYLEVQKREKLAKDAQARIISYLLGVRVGVGVGSRRMLRAPPLHLSTHPPTHLSTSPPTETTAQAKLEMRTDDDAGGTTTALPVGIEADPEEEFFVKKALRRALDGQVQQKQQAKSSAHQLESQQQQHVLNCVALEMRQARSRDLEPQP